jgi:hypothetical protein
MLHLGGSSLRLCGGASVVPSDRPLELPQLEVDHAGWVLVAAIPIQDLSSIV